jgi:acetolactate synthase-1/2/3 large subunit
MAALNGGEVLARSLVANGIDTLFGIPGVQLDPVFAGLHDVRDAMRIYHARHEQGVALMAYGYAHVTGRTGTLLVVPGPGFLNATTGILTAHACNSPLLCLVGQSERMFIGSGLGVLHELHNQMGIAASLCKWTARVEEPGRLTALLAEALNQTRTLRPRPVYLELPSDIVRMEIPDPQPVLARQDQLRPPLDADAVRETARRLAGARFPVILAGGGAAHFPEELCALAELLQIPVGMSENGLGALDARHPLAFSQLGANKLWGRADVVLALGTRLFSPVYNWGFDDELEIIKVDIDKEELGRLPVALTGIHADIGEFIRALCEELPRHPCKRTRPDAELAAVRTACNRDLSGLALPRRIVEIIRQELGEEGLLVSDVTQLNHAALDMYTVYRPHTYISSGYQGTLGFGPCTAMGAKIGCPDVPVVCLVGDGGFMYAAQELATAVQFSIPVIMLVINDGAYKNVEGILNRSYGGRAIATTLVNPDFVRFAESFGVQGRRVQTPEQLQLVLRELIARNEPAVIDFQPGEIPSAFWLRFLPQVRKQKPDNPYALVKKT